jgi:TPR repeat protein
MGMPLAQYRLGYMNEHGMDGLRINLQKAYKYYELAANGEDAHAMLGLSRLCNHAAQAPPEQQEKQLLIFQNDESGWLKTHARDQESAFRWCRLAAYKHLPEAYYLLG